MSFLPLLFEGEAIPGSVIVERMAYVKGVGMTQQCDKLAAFIHGCTGRRGG